MITEIRTKSKSIMRQITIDVDDSTEKAYSKASPEEQDRIRRIVRYSVRLLQNDDAFEEATDRLEQTVDDIGRRAAARGATEEDVNRLLHDG